MTIRSTMKILVLGESNWNLHVDIDGLPKQKDFVPKPVV